MSLDTEEVVCSGSEVVEEVVCSGESNISSVNFLASSYLLMYLLLRIIPEIPYPSIRANMKKEKTKT